jgi:hypothetical protein
MHVPENGRGKLVERVPDTANCQDMPYRSVQRDKRMEPEV